MRFSPRFTPLLDLLYIALKYSTHDLCNLCVIDMRTVAAEIVHIARVNAFPAEGKDLEVAAETALVAHSTTFKADVDTGHCRLAHLNVDAVM
jgi:hypothetical protein